MTLNHALFGTYFALFNVLDSNLHINRILCCFR